MEPDSPVYDPFRLDVIHRANLLTLDDQESFDRVARLVTRLLNVPAGTITIPPRRTDFHRRRGPERRAVKDACADNFSVGNDCHRSRP